MRRLLGQLLHLAHTLVMLFDLCLLRGDLGLAVTLEGGGEQGGVLGEAGRFADIAARPGE